MMAAHLPVLNLILAFSTIINTSAIIQYFSINLFIRNLIYEDRVSFFRLSWNEHVCILLYANNETSGEKQQTTPIKENKYIVDQKLKDYDDTSFTELVRC